MATLVSRAARILFPHGLKGSNARAIGPLASLAMLLPVLVGLGVFLFAPLMELLGQSLFSPDFSLASYAKIVEAPFYLKILLRTLWLSAVVALITLIIGYPVALVMASLSGWGALLVAAAVMVPLWTSVLVRSYAWIVLLQRNGLLNAWLTRLGIIDHPLQLLYTEGAVILAMTHVLLPFLILPIHGALKAIPKDYAQAASNLGASAWRGFLHVTLPLSLPGVYAGVIMVFVLALGFYVTPALVGGPETLLIATLIGQQTTELLNWPFAGALSAVLLGVTLLLVTAFNRFIGLDRKAV